MTDAREGLEALLRVIDDAERENEAIGVDDWYARAALLGALQTCRRAAQDVLDAMPEEPNTDSGWIDAGVHQSFADQDADTGWIVEAFQAPKRALYHVMIKPVEDTE
jgi:hypothetical protein